MKIAFVMLAAGNSRRFGSNKLLYEIERKAHVSANAGKTEESIRKNSAHFATFP